MTGPGGVGVRRGAGVALVVLGFLTLLASPALACNEARHSSAKSRPGHLGRAPLAIGDSTMILAAPSLGRLGIEADAHGCRQFSAGLSMLAQRRRAGTLPAVVILALGANGPIASGQIASALRILGRTRVLALVTPKNLSASRGRMHAAARAYPNRVLLVDWASISGRHPGWFDGDGLHPGYAGAAAFARLIRRGVAPVAFPPVKRLKVPRRARGSKACGTIRRAGRRARVYVIRGRSRMRCRTARALARRPVLRTGPAWRSYDWRRVPRSTWQWLYRRHDGRVIVGTVARS